MGVDYRTYINSKAWRDKRTGVMVRAKGRCERCGRWPVVNVHHLTYDRLGDEQPADLLGVCRQCHQEMHRD